MQFLVNLFKSGMATDLCQAVLIFYTLLALVATVPAKDRIAYVIKDVMDMHSTHRSTRNAAEPKHYETNQTLKR